MNPCEQKGGSSIFEVVYFSKSGNTKKVAEVIAAELGVQAETVQGKKALARDSFVFLGSGCYAGKPGCKLGAFIKRNDFKGRQVALFGTSGAGKGIETGALEERLKPMGAVIKGSFYCQGRFLLQNRGRPNDEDLAKAREFAKRMKEFE